MNQIKYNLLKSRERFLSLNDLEKRMSGDYLRREVDARIMIKDLVTKADLSRYANLAVLKSKIIG